MLNFDQDWNIVHYYDHPNSMYQLIDSKGCLVMELPMNEYNRILIQYISYLPGLIQTNDLILKGEDIEVIKELMEEIKIEIN